LRFEQLDRDAAALADAVGITEFSLGWVGKQREKGAWEDFYDDQTRKRVRHGYEGDFDFFGYTR
jgi:hypothetical protein